MAKVTVEQVTGWFCLECGTFNLLRDTPAVKYSTKGVLLEGECPDCGITVEFEYPEEEP